jgi:hypothetical protein
MKMYLENEPFDLTPQLPDATTDAGRMQRGLDTAAA